MTAATVVHGRDLEAWTTRVLQAAGASRAAAEVTAASLVDANRRGVDSHGVRMLQYYLPGLRSGTVNGAAEPRVVVDLPAAAIIDAEQALGAHAGVIAIELACNKAEAVGAAAVGVRNSSHFGAASYFSERAAARNHVGIVISNSDPGMSPAGALRPVLGTNPLAIAAPSGTGAPGPSLDIAASVAAHGKVVAAAHAGRDIPAGWAIDRAGQPTTSPDDALEGAMLPMGGHKGFGLAFLLDVLCGCLTGSAISPEIHNDPERAAPQGTGHLFIALSVEALARSHDYSDAVERLSEYVRGAPRASGVPAYLVPGEPEARTTRERREGIPLDAATMDILSRLGEELDVPVRL